ncbi:aspartyl protease APCB1-like [Ananas comosus]|uniref:Aspartyl protease APCB1-like n=1 Tax=Ananas comosus TaxID=4615 RepID=A0A6P5GTM9_ANACO|nr:aspartyl protease APCB1-like [Ananas comosus]
MATEEPPPPPPLSQLHGVVIISLPPPDDPSKGKTITAFTLSDSAPLHQPPPPPPQQQPSRSPPSPERRRVLSSSARKALASVLGASFLVFSLWLCLFSEAPLELLGSGSEEEGRARDEARSFLLPLYPKTRGRVLREVGDIKLAATRDEDGMEGVRLAKQGSKMTVSPSSSSSSLLTLHPHYPPRHRH